MLVVGLTFVFTMGDSQKLLETSIGVPFIQSFLNATGSYAATNIITVFIIVMLISACVSEVATASRQIWSFARDHGTWSVNGSLCHAADVRRTTMLEMAS